MKLMEIRGLEEKNLWLKNANLKQKAKHEIKISSSFQKIWDFNLSVNFITFQTVIE